MGKSQPLRSNTSRESNLQIQLLRSSAKFCGPPSPSSSSLREDTKVSRQTEKTNGKRLVLVAEGWLDVGKLFGEGKQDLQNGASGTQIAALGPLGLIYTNRELSNEQRLDIATRLVSEHGVPLAFVRQGKTS